MEKEILRLFKGFLGEKTEKINADGLKYGLLIPATANNDIIKEAIKLYGKDGQKWNQTFHKDFEIVRNAPIEDLIAQQLRHYITTYGFEDLNIYSEDTVYIPREKLEIPELREDIELIVIKALNENELKEKIMALLVSGIALSEQSVKDIMALSDFIDKNRFDEIKNREIRTTLYDKYNVMPKNPDVFFKFLLFKLTGKTLKIQNTDMINEIKSSDKELALKLLQSYINNTNRGIEKLSSIFLRNKRLFLALKINKKINNIKLDKTAKEMNALINKIRKLAVTNHRPMEINILDRLTDVNIIIEKEALLKLLENATIFREIRILNGIAYRLRGANSILYKIRNGKSYVKTLPENSNSYIKKLETIENTIREDLISRLSTKVKGKIIYIPDDITYTAPTSEKQFSGNIPMGSYIEIPRKGNLIYGIHWQNLIGNNNNLRDNFCNFYRELVKEGEERVDLDLKQLNKTEKFGWDAKYRDGNRGILFSGDVTNAPRPKGATELFYVSKDYGKGAFLITLNNYTSNSKDVPFEFVVAKTDDDADNRNNYILNPNDILMKIDMVSKTTERQMVVGFISIDETIKFYFNDFSEGGDIRTPRGGSTSTINDITKGAFDYLKSYGDVQLKLNDLLVSAGAKVINTPTILVHNYVKAEDDTIVDAPYEKKADIDLSLNAISKESIINILN